MNRFAGVYGVGTLFFLFSELTRRLMNFTVALAHLLDLNEKDLCGGEWWTLSFV